MNSSHKYKDITTPILLLLSLVSIFLLLLPYMSNGFWVDDALNSQVFFGLKRVNGDLFAFSNAVANHWLSYEGRPMFGFYIGYPLFYFFHELLQLRVAQCLMVGLNVLLYGYLMKMLGASIKILMPWAIMVVGLFQININGMDPVGAFAFHYQTLLIELGLTLIFFIKWTLNGNKNYLFASLILWLFFMFFYEINIIFIPIAFLIMIKNGSDYKKFPGFLLLLTALLYFLFILYFRTHSNGGSYSGTNFGVFGKFLSTYLEQLLSTAPLTTYIFKLRNLIGLSTIIHQASTSIAAIGLFFVSFAALSISLLQKDANLNIKPSAYIICLGMLLLPPLLPAMSLRYQNEISLGLPTLPVYYQYFGLSFLLICFLARYPKSTLFRFITVLAFSLYLSLNFVINESIKNQLDSHWRISRDRFALQLKGGFLDDVVDGDIVTFRNTPNFINENLIFQYTSKRIYNPGGDHFWFPEKSSVNPRSYEISMSEKGIYFLVKKSK
jgi:hypothetical protein